MKSGKRTKKVDVRLLKRNTMVINAKAIIDHLDLIGAELGRTGNNINQLARYANTLQKRGSLSMQIMNRFEVLFHKHIEIQNLLEVSLRKSSGRWVNEIMNSSTQRFNRSAAQLLNRSMVNSELRHKSSLDENRDSYRYRYLH
jgi:Bacterial mobilisation protein (MobC).